MLCTLRLWPLCGSLVSRDQKGTFPAHGTQIGRLRIWAATASSIRSSLADGMAEKAEMLVSINIIEGATTEYTHTGGVV